jgi:hypothetical protein
MLRAMIFATVTILSLGVGFASADAIEGTNWRATLISDDSGASPKTFKDTLHFKGGQFTSETMAAKGFKSVAYEDNTMRMGPATFTAKPESETDGSAVWSGTITADQLDGQLVWTKKNGTSVTYTLKAERTNNTSN